MMMMDRFNNLKPGFNDWEIILNYPTCLSSLVKTKLSFLFKKKASGMIFPPTRPVSRLERQYNSTKQSAF